MIYTVYYNDGRWTGRTENGRFARQRMTLLLSELRDTDMHPKVFGATLTCEKCNGSVAGIRRDDSGEWQFYGSFDGSGHYENCK